MASEYYISEKEVEEGFIARYGKQTGYWVHLWRDEDGHEFEYELIHISMITKVYKEV